MENKIITTSAILIIIALIIISQPTTVSWQLEYKDKMKENNIDSQFLIPTEIFDYHSDIIKAITPTLLDKDSLENTIRNIGDYTYFNIDYNEDDGVTDCFGIPASQVVERGEGVCSTQAKVNIALLRSMGIAARPVLGCRKLTNSCNRLFATFDDRPPRVQPIKIEDGLAISRGGLHTWLEIWIPDEGWRIMEATNGLIYDETCTDYLIKTINPVEFNVCALPASDAFLVECNNFN